MDIEAAKEKYEGKWYFLNGTNEKIRVMSVYLNTNNEIKLILGGSVNIPEKPNGIKEINTSFLETYFTPIESQLD